MPEEVAFFVAKNVRANVRELEGALRKILAYSRFNQKDINIAAGARGAEGPAVDPEPPDRRREHPEDGGRLLQDQGRRHVLQEAPGLIARPRQIAMYLAKELTQKSLPEIGELFGGRDHTTVLHAVRKIAGERQKNTELNQQLHVLEQTLKG